MTTFSTSNPQSSYDMTGNLAGNQWTYASMSTAAVHAVHTMSRTTESPVRTALLVPPSSPFYSSLTSDFDDHAPNAAQGLLAMRTGQPGNAQVPTPPTVLSVCISHELPEDSGATAEFRYGFSVCRVGAIIDGHQTTVARLIRLGILFPSGHVHVVLLDAHQPCAWHALRDWMMAGAIPVKLEHGAQPRWLVLSLQPQWREQLQLTLEQAGDPSEAVLHQILLQRDELCPPAMGSPMTIHIATEAAGWFGVEATIELARQNSSGT